MTKDVSISDVKRDILGGSYTLRATVETLARLETETGEAYAVVFQRLGDGVPRLVDVSIAFACFALPHGKHSQYSIRKAMPFDDGQCLIEMYNFVRDAVNAAKAPDDKKTDEAGDTGATNGPAADPQ